MNKLQKLDQKIIEKALNDFSKNNFTHKKGLFILAPSGCGKTYFVNHQKENKWIDGDELWIASGAQPDNLCWLEDYPTILEVDKRSDIVTKMAIDKGFWIMGASSYNLKPDAIVVPVWSDHKNMILLREKTNYDGGATEDSLDDVIDHREWIMKWTDEGVPRFHSINDAVEYLEKLV